MTLFDLVAHIGARDQIRVHLGDVSWTDHDGMSYVLFHSAFKVSHELVITPRPSDGRRVPKEYFPWFLGVAPIDYESRLEAELARYWGSFEKDKEHAVVVGEVEGIKIRRSITVYRHAPTA